jgi:L-iditol 2-dehydrogenase
LKLARYIGGGEIAIVDEPIPACPPGGLLVKTEASGLCSGELMDWYMEKKVPHVLGHECAGIIVESQSEEFPVGSRVFVHHHAPCLKCDFCARGLYVQCDQWKRTKLVPGGMAEYFAVSPDNFHDTFSVGQMRPQDAALIEPLACVVKSALLCKDRAQLKDQAGAIRPLTASKRMPADFDRLIEMINTGLWGSPCAVIGLGVMGLMHLLILRNAIGYDINNLRVDYARSLGLDSREPAQAEKADAVFVCPGTKAALDFAIEIANPGATIVLFAPMPPGDETPVDLKRLYFNEIRLVSSYSCGPKDTRIAADLIEEGTVTAEQVVSHFIGIDELPDTYQKMKRGEILKPMVLF